MSLLIISTSIASSATHSRYRWHTEWKGYPKISLKSLPSHVSLYPWPSWCCTHQQGRPSACYTPKYKYQNLSNLALKFKPSRPGNSLMNLLHPLQPNDTHHIAEQPELHIVLQMRSHHQLVQLHHNVPTFIHNSFPNEGKHIQAQSTILIPPPSPTWTHSHFSYVPSPTVFSLVSHFTTSIPLPHTCICFSFSGLCLTTCL